ncbi:DAK2 domain-containing protein [Marmoricola sp. URHB0036]|uniref:DAK2 domain-containing protein n=1 Tax=Marmoricola sp. URHB0036 TaxID=1298863 RepID=UPI0003FBE07B|nr:DAK2 domain-containing protein [Marmoricola sp. URHB0036]
MAQADVATFDLDVVRRFADLAVDGLSASREEIDALNVYPVPDGDTGTNMFLTVESARDAMAAALEEHPDDLRLAMRAYARGALLGARGNSGVIFSQLIGALLRRIGRAGPDDRSASVFAEGMALATEAAYAAVGKPVEGTILSVARAASEAAATAAEVREDRLGDVVRAAASAAREALARTPEQLPVLAQAGVVDAGGRGLCVVLDAAESAITGKRATTATPHVGSPAIPVARIQTGDLTEGGPAYEVMYLLEADDDAIAPLREELASLGDSLVVVGGEGLWNVHVHVADVGAAVEAGIRAGSPRRIEVTHFAEQIDRARDKRAERRGRRLVIVAAGPGLNALFRESGALVIDGGPGRRPSTREVLEAIEQTAAEEVIVLPNDPDSLGVAEAAAHEAEAKGIHVVVIPTRAQVQGIAALAVHEPGRPLDSDVVHMTAAARGARHGAVTVAAKDAMTTAGPCSVGDALGVINGDFAIVAKDLYEVACGVLERLIGGGGELVTLVAGAEAGDLAQACEAWVQRAHPGVDVVVYEGGQDRYPLLVAVE